MPRGSANEIASEIEATIADGRLSPGEQLASVRELSSELGVAPATVAAAYRRLRERGLVIGRGRQGTRVAPRSQPVAQFSTVVDADLIDAMNGTPDPAFLPDLGAIFAEVASRPQPRYGHPMITDELAGAATQHFEVDGINATNLTVTSGSMDAIERVLLAQGFRRGDRVGVEDPGHIPVHQVIRSAGLELVSLPVDAYGITNDGLANAIDSGLVAVVVTPRAQNPTGAALSPERAATLNQQLAKHPDTMVIQDDHAGPIAGTAYVPLTAPGPRWATIRSMGKSFGPDLRVAVVAGDANTISRVTTAVANGPGWVSHVLQRATAFALTDPATTALVARAAESYQRRRSLLIDALADHGVAASGRSGLNVWIPTADEQGAVDAARRAGYAIRAADLWRLNSGPAVRVTIANLAEDDLARIAEALDPRRAPRRLAGAI